MGRYEEWQRFSEEDREVWYDDHVRRLAAEERLARCADVMPFRDRNVEQASVGCALPPALADGQGSGRTAGIGRADHDPPTDA